MQNGKTLLRSGKTTRSVQVSVMPKRRLRYQKPETLMTGMNFALRCMSAGEPSASCEP